jgi:hypothetical protein
MRYFYIVAPLLALLAASLWFAITAWGRIAGDPIPAYAWFAIAGGAIFSVLIGGGLMALMFYSSRHGYDDRNSGDDTNNAL